MLNYAIEDDFHRLEKNLSLRSIHLLIINALVPINLGKLAPLPPKNMSKLGPPHLEWNIFSPKKTVLIGPPWHGSRNHMDRWSYLQTSCEQCLDLQRYHYRSIFHSPSLPKFCLLRQHFRICLQVLHSPPIMSTIQFNYWVVSSIF